MNSILLCPVTPPFAVVSLITNELTRFFVLLSHYPILQSIPTYYSLIGAVYVYRRCLCKSSPRIASPLVIVEFVLPFSCDYLVPPHFPEPRIARFSPQCIYSPHLSFYLFASLSVIFLLFIPVTCCLYPEICLVPVSCSWYLFPVIRSSFVSHVNCCLLYFCI